METLKTDQGPLTVISIEGNLELGDEVKFTKFALEPTGAVVLLSSPGGNELAGIEIGKAIRLKGFATFVPEGFVCASACATAWLGGTPRWMSKRSRIGFHAAYEEQDGQPHVSSAGNAVLGAYLGQLGLSMKAIQYLTTAQPADMQWLTFEDAEAIGLDVKPLELAETAPDTAAARAQSDNRNPSEAAGTPPDVVPQTGEWIQVFSRPNPAEAIQLAQAQSNRFPNTAVFAFNNGWYVVVMGPYQPGTAGPIVANLVSSGAVPADSLVTQGTRFLQRVWAASTSSPDAGTTGGTASSNALGVASAFFASWSGPNQSALAYLGDLYAPEVVYFGKRVTKFDVVSEKATFVARWQERSYRIRPGSTSALCDTDGSCQVLGVVDFKAYNPSSDITSSGAATFALLFKGSGPQSLIAETSTVIARQRHKGR